MYKSSGRMVEDFISLMWRALFVVTGIGDQGCPRRHQTDRQRLRQIMTR